LRQFSTAAWTLKIKNKPLTQKRPGICLRDLYTNKTPQTKKGGSAALRMILMCVHEVVHRIYSKNASLGNGTSSMEKKRSNVPKSLFGKDFAGAGDASMMKPTCTWLAAAAMCTSLAAAFSPVAFVPRRAVRFTRSGGGMQMALSKVTDITKVRYTCCSHPCRPCMGGLKVISCTVNNLVPRVCIAKNAPKTNHERCQ